MFIIIEKTGNFNLQRGDLETCPCSKQKYDVVIEKILFIEDENQKAAAEAIFFKSQFLDQNDNLKDENGNFVATGNEVVPLYDAEGKFTGFE